MKRKKYLKGGGVSTRETVGDALSENRQYINEAQAEASSNAWVQGLQISGELMSQAFASYTPTGKEPTTVNSATNPGKDPSIWDGGTENYGHYAPEGMLAAFGGTMAQSVEAEGGEIVQTPGGKPKELKGASHEKGGIDLEVPEGTDFFSVRVKGKDGKTMAERKKSREAKHAKIKKLFDASPTDGLLKNSLEATSKANAQEEEEDLELMNSIREVTNTVGQMFAEGGTTGDKLKEFMGDNTAGDLIGMGSNIYGMFASAQNTRNAIANTPENENQFKDYGKEGLAKMDESKNFIKAQEAETMKDIELARTTSVMRNRKSARGVNTMRAMDIATGQQSTAAKANARFTAASQMSNILGKEAQMEDRQDQVVMQGEATRDLADRQDTDAKYSQLGQIISSNMKGTQAIASQMNKAKEREVRNKMIATKNWKWDALTGKYTFVPDADFKELKF